MATIKVNNDPGKQEFPMAALSRPGEPGEVIEVQGIKKALIRQITPEEARAQCLQFFVEIMSRVPQGITVYWYEAHDLTVANGDSQAKQLNRRKAK